MALPLRKYFLKKKSTFIRATRVWIQIDFFSQPMPCLHATPECYQITYKKVLKKCYLKIKDNLLKTTYQNINTDLLQYFGKKCGSFSPKIVARKKVV